MSFLLTYYSDYLQAYCVIYVKADTVTSILWLSWS
jgi:hypothetical protein